MVYSIDFEELAGKIKPLETAKYLCDLGWNEIPTKTDALKIFQFKSNDDFFQVDLPMSRDLRNYNWTMFKVAESIAHSAKKSIEQVVLELLNPLSDILRFRIHDESAISGSLIMEDCVNLYENAKKLITAAAMDVEQPRIFHAGRPSFNISEFIGSCRFGQTEIGSYVVSVVCPFGYLDNNRWVQRTVFSDAEQCSDSLTRKTVNKVITSINTITELTAGNFKAIPEHGISANFLDALNNINIYRKGSTLDLTVKYAPTISKNTLTITTASINHDYHAPISSLVSRIKSVQEREETFVGRIKDLSALPELENRRQGKIVVVYPNEQFKISRVSTVLSTDNYDAAIDAHRNGKQVRLVGTISGTSRVPSVNCSYFEVL